MMNILDPSVTCNQLIKNVLSFYNPTKSDEERNEYREKCDNFFKNSGIDIKCAQVLIHNQSHYVQYFALQLLSYRYPFQKHLMCDMIPM